MKKILIAIFSLLSITSTSQVKLSGNGFWNVRTFKQGWTTSTSDSLGYIDSLKIKWFKPVRMGAYTTSGAPTASAFQGYMIYNTDSNKVQYSDGSTWQNLEAGTGGGGANPGGSGTEMQYRAGASTFGGAAGTSWDNTNSLFTMFKGGLGVTQTLSTGWMLQNTTAATSGNQQISPAYWAEGRGFETTGSTSQSVRMGWHVLPEQSTTTNGIFQLLQSVNGGSISVPLQYQVRQNYLKLQSQTTGNIYWTSSTTDKYIAAAARSDFIFGNGISTRTSGTFTVYPGTSVVEPNTYTTTFFNVIHTTLPQLNAAYDASNYTSFRTNSGGDLTIDPTGGDITIDGTVKINTVADATTPDSILTVEGGVVTKVGTNALGFVSEYYGKSTSVNGSPVNLITLPTQTDSAYAIKVEYTGSTQSAPDVVWKTLKALVTNNSGTVTIETQTTEETLQAGSSFTHTIQLGVSGTDIQVLVTGDGLGVTQRWVARARVMPFQFK